MTVKFVDEVPAQVKTHKGRNQRIVDTLSEKPGQWAIVYRLANRSTASSRASTLRKLGAEVTTRTEGGRVLLYARVNGAVKKRVRKSRKTVNSNND